MWSVFAAGLLLTAQLSAQVTIDAFADKLVVQRQPSMDPTVEVGSRAFSGTYGGPSEPIEGRVVQALDGTPQSPWQVLDEAPEGGVWSGTLGSIPAGGWYRLEIRKGSGTEAPSLSAQRFGVGEIVLMFGQSNMARLFTEDAADGSPLLPEVPPHDLTWRLGYGEPDGYAYERPRSDDIPVSWGPVTGSGGVRLANRLQEELGVPILVLDFALDWTGIDAHWNEQDGPFIGWSKLAAGLQEVGPIGAAVWAQGAYDAVNRPAISVDDYRTGLDTLYSRLLGALPAGQAPPFGIIFLNRGDYTQDSQFDASFQAVRQAQRQWVQEHAAGFAAGSAMDIDLSVRPEAGVGHFWATGYQLLADRAAQGLLQVLAPADSPRGLSVAGGRLHRATLVGRHIEVDVLHDLGSRLRLPDSNEDIGGLEVTQGAWGVDDLTIERAVLSSSEAGNHVVITLAETPTAPVRLRYLHGQNPNRSAGPVVPRRRRGNWLYDDAAYHPERTGLPIQATADDLLVTSLATFNLPPNPQDDHVAVGPGGRVEIDVLINDSDPEHELDPASIVLIDDGLHGQATFDASRGLVTYQHGGAPPDATANVDSFTYAVADRQGLVSEVATVHVEILDFGFPPVDGRVLHVEANQGLDIDQGGRVIAWHDRSGIGNDLQGVGDTYRQAGALNGQDCIELDGQGDKLERTRQLRNLPSGNSDRTVFTVMRYNEEGFGGFAWGSTTEGMGCALGGNRAFGLIVDPSGDLAVQGWCTDFRTTTPGTAAGWLVQSAKVESNQLFHYRNGKLIDQRNHAFNTDADGTLVIGAELDSSPYIAMDVAAVLIFDRALSESERMRVDSYLRQKYLGEQLIPPTSNHDVFQVTLGGTTELEVLANDSGNSLPIDPSRVTVLTSPQHGDLSLDTESGVIVYRHDGSASLDDTFRYTVADASGNTSAPADVSLTIVAPTAELVTRGLVLHLETDHGVVTGDDNEVLSWLDGSLQGHDVATAGAGPQMRQGGLGSHAYLSFDGNNDRLSRSTDLQLPTGNSDRSVFMLVRYRGDGFGGVTWGAAECNGVFGPGVDSRGLLAVQGWCFGFDTVSQVSGVGAGWQLHSAIHEDSLLHHYADDTLLNASEHVFNTAADGTLALGYELDGFPFVAMDLAAVLIYDHALGTADRIRVTSYLREKYLPSAPQGGDQPPDAMDDLVEALPGQTTSFDVLANDDDDVALDPASLRIEQLPQHGFASVDPQRGTLEYRHDGSASLSDQLTYRVADSAGQLSEVASVLITLGTPLTVTEGLVLRLEPQAGTFLDDGDAHLEAWLDLSGHGNDVLANGRPRMDHVGPGGYPFVRLDGFDDHLTNVETLRNLPGGDAERTLIAVVRYRGPGFGGVGYGATECNRVFGAVVDTQGRLTTQGWCFGNDYVTDSTAGGDDWLTHTALVQSGTLWQYRDGQLIDTAQHVFDTAAEGRLVIGAELDFSPHVPMDVAAVLLFDRALSESERRAVETYLGQRYRGLAGPPEPLVGVPDVAHVALAGSTLLDVLANDSGDLDPTSLRIVTAPSHGTVHLDGQRGALQYVHSADGNAFVDRFTYEVEDTSGQVSQPTEVQLVVLPTVDGLVFHLDAAVGPVLDDGSVIGWLDLAAGANDLGAVGAPRLGATRNGAAAVTFDGVDDHLRNLHPLAALPNGDDHRTVVVVANYQGGGFGGVTWGSTDAGDCATQGNRAFGTVVDFRGELAIQGWCFGNDFLSGVAGTGAGWLVQTTVAGGGLYEHFRNSAAIDGGAHAFNTDGSGDLLIAAELDGSPSVDMELASVLIFDRRLDDAERQQLEIYLRTRFIDD